MRVERAPNETALSVASASVGVLREPQYKRCAFTMAEILLSLTIIGVVAAITLPSLTGNINERTWNTQRKALYARFSQAIMLMPALNGYGQYEGTNTSGVVTTTQDTAAETFLTEGLSKVFKINNICDNDHLGDCGIPTSLVTIDGTTKDFAKKMSDLNSMFTETYTETNEAGSTKTWTNTQNFIDTKAAAFETQNGESIAVYYNPQCHAYIDESLHCQYAQPKMCANFIFDLNGTKGPNTFGKDIGVITALYATDTSVVMPIPTNANATAEKVEHKNALGICKAQNVDSRMPNRDEVMAMFYNASFLNIPTQTYYWSGTTSHGNTKAWVQDFRSGNVCTDPKTNTSDVRCIIRH